MRQELKKMLKQLMTPPVCVTKVDRWILSQRDQVCRRIWWLHIRQISSIVIFIHTEVMNDASALDKLAGFFEALESDLVLKRVKSVLQNSETSFHRISCSCVGGVELLLGPIKLTTEGSNQPVVVGVACVP